MADALAHSCDSHSRAVGLNFSESFRGHSIPLVFNLYVEPVPFALKSNQRGFASRVTVNVCQTFLHRSEGDLRMRFGPMMRCPDKRQEQHQVLKANRAKQSRQRVKRHQMVRSLQEQNDSDP